MNSAFIILTFWSGVLVLLVLSVLFTASLLHYRALNGIGYRLGDMVLLPNERKNIFKGYLYHKLLFPESIATQYMDMTDKLPEDKQNGNIFILKSILTEKYRQANACPKPHGAVVHCRVGDVIDDQPYSVKEFLESARLHKPIGKNYVKPRNFYESIATRLKTQHPKVNRITLVAGFHSSGKHGKSLEYLRQVRQIFENHGYIVTLRLNKPADDDFIFMTRCNIFVASGGGFSRLISMLVTEHGGTVL